MGPLAIDADVDEKPAGDLHGRGMGKLPNDRRSTLDQVKDAGGPLWITGYDSARFLRSVAFGLAKRGY